MQKVKTGNGEMPRLSILLLSRWSGKHDVCHAIA